MSQQKDAALCLRCRAELPEGAPFCPWCGRRQAPAPRTRKRRTPGSGSICKLSGKRSKPYVARLNGVTIGTFATVREADRALARLVDTDIGDKYNWTFRQVYEAWKPEHADLLRSRAQARGTGTTGMATYSGAFKHCAELHDRPMRSIRKADLQAILSKMADDGLSHSTICKMRQLFSQLYQWAMAEHIVSVNLAPALDVVPPKKAEPKTFTPEEVQAIAASELPAARVALILLATGCRIGELFALRLEDCAADYFVSGSKTDAGTRRVIPVSPIGLAAYQELRRAAVAKGAELLIDGYEGNHNSSNWRKREYYPMLDALGISREKTPHKTRHTYATAAVSAGVAPEDLKGILGHASYTTTVDIYTHKSPDVLIAAAASIDPSASKQTDQ